MRLSLPVFPVLILVSSALACGSSGSVDNTAGDASGGGHYADGGRRGDAGPEGGDGASGERSRDGSFDGNGGRNGDAGTGTEGGRHGDAGPGKDGGPNGGDANGDTDARAAHDGAGGTDGGPRQDGGNGGRDGGHEDGSTSDAAGRDARADAPGMTFSACGDIGGLQPGAPWPMRGRCPTRIARGDAVGPARANPKWSYSFNGVQAFDLGAIITTPVVDANGTIYVGIDGTGTVSSSLSALTSTGTLAWTYTTSSPVRSGPLVRADGSILAGSDDGTLFVVEAATGQLRWSTSLGGVLSSPLVTTGGTIYVGASNQEQLVNGVVALDENGTILWRAFNTIPYECDLELGGPSLRQDGTIWMNCSDHLVSMSLQGVSGPVADSFITDFIITAPPSIGADGSLWFGGSDNAGFETDTTLFRYPLTGQWTKLLAPWMVEALSGGVALLPNGDAVFSAPSGSISTGTEDLYLANAAATTVTDIAAESGRTPAQPTVDSAGNVYFGNFDTLYAVTASGASRWSAGVGPIQVGIAMGADGTLYAGTTDGYVIALAP